MRILQIGKFYPIKGGVEKVMYNIMIGLSHNGMYCDMLCAVAGKQKPGIIKINRYARLFCMSTWLNLCGTMISPAMIVMLWELRRDYDVIHIHHPDPMAALSLFLSGYKGRVVLHWHSDILAQKLLLKFYRPLQWWLIKRADAIVGTSPVYTEQSPWLKQVQDKITCIPIGIDEPVRNPQMETRLRSKYSGKKIIFSLGRLVEYKGYRYLIKAAKYLDDEYVVLIGGAGPLKDHLQALIDKSRLTAKVELLGFIPDSDLPGYFGACDLFCLSSVQRTEAFGIVQIEAMSFRKPLVATRIKGSGVSWVNADKVSGLNVKPCNAKALADAISTILSDKHLYNRLSEGAYRRYKEVFTKELMIEKCLSLYRHILKKVSSDI